MTDPFFDQAVMAGIAGYQDNSFRHLVTWPLRRWWSAYWFQPIARIGGVGGGALLLISDDGDKARQVGTDASGRKIPKRFYEDQDYAARLKELRSGEARDDPSRMNFNSPIPSAELPAARYIWSKYQLHKTYVSSFTPKNDGELFLYVNDAVVAIPFRKTMTSFYDNNTGQARITVQLLSSASPSQ